MTIDVKNPASTPQMKNLKATPEDVSYRLHAHRLPIPRPSESDSFITPQSLRVTGLKRGNYNILIDNKTVATVSARALAQGVEISLPFGPQVEELIQLIYKKNRTFFHQYRPQNETYLVGFREYEQGQNARELALLNPLIGQIENEIGRLRIPRDVSVHIVAE